MISLDKISMHFGAVEIFRDVSLVVNPRDRIGLVGRNGAGKTTLLRIFVGLQIPSEGKVVCPDDLKIGYLPQQMKHKDKLTVWEEVLEAFAEVRKLEKEIDSIHELLEDPDADLQSEHAGILDRYDELNQQFQMLGGASYEAGIELTLLGLGFNKSDFHRSTREFSGGWRMRIELARMLLQSPDVLLLDEPTNHLDIESIQWLENFLSTYRGAVLLISHDRAFLDAVTIRTVEISLGKIYDYKVPYSKFRVLRKERREQQLATYRNQQKVIEDTEKFIERFRYKATKAVQVQSRIKQLERLDRVEIELEDFASFNLRFPPAPRSGTIVVEAKQLTKRYGEHIVLEKIDLVIERGEKVAFVGKNGEGKTTLSRIIIGELDHEGHSRIGHQVNIGYFAQNLDAIMNENKTVFETIDDVAVGDIRTQVRSILGAFLFHGDDVDKKVKVLSGGERSRLALARLLLKPYNLLILDEPTNHLDMRSKDILKHALMQYNGTLIVVSHDRAFLDGLVGKIYEFGNRKVKEHLGGIYEFLNRKKIVTLKELEKKEKVTEVKTATITQPPADKPDYKKKKEFESRLRKAIKKVEDSEREIARLELAIEEMDQAMQDPQKIDDQDIFKKYEELRNLLFAEMVSWENNQMELDKLKDRGK